jgi:hypothetical protein
MRRLRIELFNGNYIRVFYKEDKQAVSEEHRQCLARYALVISDTDNFLT